MACPAKPRQEQQQQRSSGSRSASGRGSRGSSSSSSRRSRSSSSSSSSSRVHLFSLLQHEAEHHVPTVSVDGSMALGEAHRASALPLEAWPRAGELQRLEVRAAANLFYTLLACAWDSQGSGGLGARQFLDIDWVFMLGFFGFHSARARDATHTPTMAQKPRVEAPKPFSPIQLLYGLKPWGFPFSLNSKP